MKCPLCGHYFTSEEGHACPGCPLAGTCHKVRCPNCGYEIPEEPGLIKTLKSWRQRIGTGRTGRRTA